MTAIKLTVLTALTILGMVLMAGVVSAQDVSQAQSRITMDDIDSALQKGPVFLEFETKECSYCRQQKPITESLESEYSGNVTFFYIDAAENRDIARKFQVSGVPQMNVIVSKTDGGYTYAGRDGRTSENLGETKFVGLTQGDVLKSALDAAVQMRGT